LTHSCCAWLNFIINAVNMDRQDIYAKLNERGIALPNVGAPSAAYAMCAERKFRLPVRPPREKGRAGLGGQTRRDVDDGRWQHGGTFGCHRFARDASCPSLGDPNRVKRIVKMTSLVNSTADFTGQHLVTNGASELFADVFGESGMHARSAFGVAQIPLGACVEIELIVEVACGSDRA
jgi:hypothetical protein